MGILPNELDAKFPTGKMLQMEFKSTKYFKFSNYSIRNYQKNI